MRKTIREEIEDILVDTYSQDEEASSWGVAFEDSTSVPFAATLLGESVEVQEFRSSNSGIPQCLVVRKGRKRWIAVEDLDEKGLPESLAHVLKLYRAWNEGDY